jgi:hypothetical protein
MKDFIPFISSYVHSFSATYGIHFFHFRDICYLDFSGSTKFLESTVVFDSFSEGSSSIGSRMLCLFPSVCLISKKPS